MSDRQPIFQTGPLDTARVEAFSDGVLAVVITLLVLDLKIPPGVHADPEVWGAVADLAPALGAWVVSFAFVLTFWVNHHYFFSSLKYTDRGLLWLNGLFLLTVALIPFPTALVGAHPGLTAPLVLLSAAMLATSLSFSIMRYYANFHGRLLRHPPTAAEASRAMRHSLSAPVLYGLAIVMAFIWPPGAILAQIVVLLVFFLRSPGHPHVAETSDP